MTHIKQILYVDDEEVNKFLFKNYFKNNYEVFTARLAQDALDILDQQPEISVVISDFQMPVMDGVDFVKIAKEKYPDKRYYMLTGYDQVNKISEALESGLILEKFTKPTRYEVIENVINQETPIN